MRKAAFISILILLLASACSQAGGLVGIKTGTGYLILNQEPGNYFSIEIQVPDMPTMGHFLVGKNQLQIASTPVSDFLKDPATLSDSRAVLDPGTAETVSKIQKNAWATLKFRDAPWTITDIKAFSNRFRSKH